MTKAQALAALILTVLGMTCTVAGYAYGFGLTVVSWPALIGGIVAGLVLIMVAKSIA